MKIVNIGGAKAVAAEYRGNRIYLLFNGEAMFALQDDYGSDFYAALSDLDRQGREKLLHIAYVLMEQGELARRAVGLDKRELPEESEWASPVFFQPHDIATLRAACMDAIQVGYTREVADKEDEIDVYMLEIQKKRDNPEPCT